MNVNDRRLIPSASALAGLVLSLALASTTLEAADPRVEVTPTVFRAGGYLIHGDRGRLFVPENREAADSRLIEIGFVRLRQEESESSTEPPVVFLPGGPGQPVVESAKDFAATYKNYLNLGGRGDMLVVEQRGIGQSKPRLDCPGELSRPVDQPLSVEIMGSTHRRFIEDCMAHWIEQGVDPAGYNVVSMADDIDALRQGLGYEKIKIFGESFGAHHGLAVIARHGEHVERAVLSAVIGPDDMFELPDDVDERLTTVERRAMEAGQWRSDAPMAAVLDGLDQPIDVHLQSDRHDLSLALGRYDLALATVTLAQQTGFLEQLPTLYGAIAAGDASWLASWSANLRTGHGSNLASMLITCASGASSERRAEITRQAAKSPLGDAIDLLGGETCAPVADLELDGQFRQPINADMPVLLISGELDPRAPASNAEAILPDLEQGHHVVFPNVSHDFGRARTAKLELAYRFLARGETEPNPKLLPARP